MEQLADEMTAELRNDRDAAITRVLATGVSQRVPLRAKGINFGHITIDSGGSVDESEIEGVDPDLRVRPFFHHGQTASIL